MFKLWCRIFQAFFGLIIKALGEGKQEYYAGEGSLLKINEILKKANKHKPLIVTGKRVSKTDFFRELMEELPMAVVFSDVVPDPTTECVKQIAAAFRSNGCDSLIAIGGGSNIDGAKAAGALIARPKASVKKLGGVLKVRKKIPFFIAVPTTAGTGSECTVAAVVTDEAAGRKYAINDPHLLPDVAVLDPVLSCTLPQNLTAWTGMDALTHAVEAYLNARYHLKNTGKLCEEAVVAIFKWLPIAYEELDNIQARQELLLASYKAGKAFTTACVGNIHALAHTLGGQYHVPHGKANAIILPQVLEAYGDKVYKPLARLSYITGLCSSEIGDDGYCDEEKAAKRFIEHIRFLNRTFNIPERVEEIEEKNIGKMAEWAYKEANPLYPVPVIFSKEDMANMLRKLKK